jgi:tetratricopeptide (TPR) repeat protein
VLFDLQEGALIEHPTAQLLESFLHGTLSEEDFKAVLCHVLGCQPCARGLLPAPVPEAAYDEPISRVFAALVEEEERRDRERSEAERWLTEFLRGGRSFAELSAVERERLRTWNLCEVLMEKSWALRQDDPKGMIELAELAVAVAEKLPLARYGELLLGEHQACTWGELTNALRVAEDLDRADEALEVAFERLPKASESDLLLARLDDVAASLRADERRFGEAFGFLRMAYYLYMRQGRRHDAGRMLIQLGLYSGYDNDPEEGIRRLGDGLQMIDRDREPRLVFSALHNILMFTVEMEDYRWARQLLFRMRPLYGHYAGRLDQLKLRDIEGRIASGLGEFGRAEDAFSQVRAGFEAEGLFYYAAIAGLDLAAVWYRQGKTPQIQQLVTELVTEFRRVGVEREALAALLMLRKALDRDEATLYTIEFTADLLRGLEEWKRARG